MFDTYFSSQVKGQKNRRSREYSEEQLEECRKLLNLSPPERMESYKEFKQILYTRTPISPSHQLFVDKIDAAIRRSSRKWGKWEVLNEEIAKIRI